MSLLSYLDLPEFELTTHDSWSWKLFNYMKYTTNCYIGNHSFTASFAVTSVGWNSFLELKTFQSKVTLTQVHTINLNCIISKSIIIIKSKTKESAPLFCQCPSFLCFIFFKMQRATFFLSIIMNFAFLRYISLFRFT